MPAVLLPSIVKTEKRAEQVTDSSDPLAAAVIGTEKKWSGSKMLSREVTGRVRKLGQVAAVYSAVATARVNVGTEMWECFQPNPSDITVTPQGMTFHDCSLLETKIWTSK